MEFEEIFKQYLQKVERLQKQLDTLTEESTKTTLIMPFFSMLGYDVFDADEFMPEFTCDVATKKGEKVDYAILKDGEPVILIEVKRAGMKLQKQQQGQLFRYFSTNRCRIAILTNGITYYFFSDLNSPNVMDDEPFLSFNLIEDDPAIYVPSVRQFCKGKFDIKHVISKAVYQKYAKVVEKTLKQDLISPSDELVKYFLSRPEIKSGNRITAQMIEKYREITQEAMQKVMGITIQNVITEKCDGTPIAKEVELEAANSSPVVESVPEATKQLPITIDTISEAIISIGENNISDFACTQEDNSEFIRLHIYTTDNKKIGAVKILRSDLSITFRKFENGIPTSYDLSSAEDIKKYL